MASWKLRKLLLPIPSMSHDKACSAEPLVQLFLELVRIPSPSGEERAMVDFLTTRLRGLGFEVEEEESLAEGKDAAGNLYCHLDGSGSGIPVLLSAHTDTVASEPEALPNPQIKDGVISSGSRAVLGADDKAAVAAIVFAMEEIVHGNMPHAGIELLFTVGEEEGLKGAKAFSLEKINARCGFCFDSTGPVGEVIVRSPSQKTIRANFIGKAAHAGVVPEEGRSAVLAAAKAVAAMRLGRLDEDTTANIGIIKGGEAVNVVPDRCSITGECRSHEEEKLEAQVADMLQAINNAAAGEEVDVETTVVDEFRAFDLRGGNLPVDLAHMSLKQIGIEPVLASTGGASDVNEFNRKGLPSVNLSVGMEQVHSPDEYITVESLRQACRLVLGIIKNAQK